MATDKTNKLCSLIIIVLMGMGGSSDYAFSENSVFPNPQSSQGTGFPPNTPQTFCENISKKKFVDSCRNLKLGDLPLIEGLEAEDVILFAEAVQGPIETFMNSESFKKITKNPEQLVQRLGFDDLAQLEMVRPGPVLVVKWVRLDTLSQFKSGDNPDKIMAFANSIIVPLSIQGKEGEVAQVMSSLTLGLFKKEKEKEWRWTRRGAQSRIRKIYEYRNEANELVEIPGLNLRFIGKRASGEVRLIPLYDAKFEGFELNAGVEQPASDVFSGLAIEAKAILDKLKTIQKGSRQALR